MVLDKVNSIDDVKKLNIKEKKKLANEIREFLIDKVSKTGGHLASNLGVVELTIALVSVFDFDKDKIIFDVGHQSYVYKILTGRKEQFDRLRMYKGLRGFPYRSESKYDFFETGHSSTSISASLGIARARDLKKEDFNVISLVGDAAISNGMSLEAINDLGYRKTKMLVILNDNGMSISSNVGGLSSYLSRISINKKYINLKNKVKHSVDGTYLGDKFIRVTSAVKHRVKGFLVPSKYFEAMGLTYVGPIDGHDINLLIKVLNRIKNKDEPVLLHVVTTKGKGYEKALIDPESYHGVKSFDKNLGVLKQVGATYSEEFGKALLNLAKKDPKIVVITAAMKEGVGLSKFFKDYPERSFDVGICEEHSVTLAAGLANEGMRPVLAIYSTFLQRGIDQVIHDVSMQKLPVIFAIDRAGIVGDDGETHQGIFDLSYLSMIPNLVIIAPKHATDLETILKWSLKQGFPIAIRYPRGKDYFAMDKLKKVELGKWEVLREGEKTAVLAVGKMSQKALEAVEKSRKNVMVVSVTFVKPVDKELLMYLKDKKYNIITIEDNLLNGGLGSKVQMYLNEIGFSKKIVSLGYKDKFIEQGSIEELYESENLSVDAIVSVINKLNK